MLVNRPTSAIGFLSSARGRAERQPLVGGLGQHLLHLLAHRVDAESLLQIGAGADELVAFLIVAHGDQEMLVGDFAVGQMAIIRKAGKPPVAAQRLPPGQRPSDEAAFAVRLLFRILVVFVPAPLVAGRLPYQFPI